MTFRRTLAEAVSRLRDWPSRRALPLEELRQRLSPVFIVGGNRSGTSMVSSILSQHPELEGIFSGDTESTYNEAGHSNGFCESFHLWKFLVDSARDTRSQDNHLPFWSLPQYLAAFYRHRPKDRKEILEIVWDLQRNRSTEKQPFIKNQYNTLRIGLLSEVFPHARYVLVSRPWRDFIERGIHKWSHDGNNTDLRADRPRVGFHWHLLNLIARYDLETYVPGRYVEIWLNVLHRGPEAAQKEFQRVLAALSLAPFEFDLGVLGPQWEKRKQREQEFENAEFDVIRDIIKLERRVVTAMRKDGEGSS